MCFELRKTLSLGRSWLPSTVLRTRSCFLTRRSARETLLICRCSVPALSRCPVESVRSTSTFPAFVAPGSPDQPARRNDSLGSSSRHRLARQFADHFALVAHAFALVDVGLAHQADGRR